MAHRYAIIETNKLLANKADYICSGVEKIWDSAYEAVESAPKRAKKSFVIGKICKERGDFPFVGVENAKNFLKYAKIFQKGLEIVLKIC